MTNDAFRLLKNAEKAKNQGDSEPDKLNQGEQKSLDEILAKYEPHSADIHTQYNVGGLIFTVFETQGKRYEQQDSYVLMSTKDDTPHGPAQFLSDSFDDIDRYLRERHVQSGSTANVVYISQKQTITVANTGDARTVLLIRDIRTGDIATRRLSYDQRSNDPTEGKRIRENGGFVMRGRLNGTLAPARAFGDYHLKGISFKPDISQVSLPELVSDPERFEVFIINSCDGLYETLHERDLARLASKALGVGPSTSESAQYSMSALFSKAAYVFGSNDNITVTVGKLSPSQDSNILIGVFDGHGGDAASKLAAERLSKIVTRSKSPFCDPT